MFHKLLLYTIGQCMCITHMKWLTSLIEIGSVTWYLSSFARRVLGMTFDAVRFLSP